MNAPENTSPNGKTVVSQTYGSVWIIVHNGVLMGSAKSAKGARGLAARKGLWS